MGCHRVMRHPLLLLPCCPLPSELDLLRQSPASGLQDSKSVPWPPEGPALQERHKTQVHRRGAPAGGSYMSSSSKQGSDPQGCDLPEGRRTKVSVALIGTTGVHSLSSMSLERLSSQKAEAGPLVCTGPIFALAYYKNTNKKNPPKQKKNTSNSV